MKPDVDVLEQYKDNWIQTWSGLKFHLFRPKGKEVDIRDIAKALSRIPRFNGHLLRFYSVAEHCVHASHHVASGYELDALMHDAAEAYIGDIPSPLKHAMPEFIKPVEDRIMKVIAAKFGFVWPMPDPVKLIDMDLLKNEAEKLFPFCIDEWSQQINAVPMPQLELQCWLPKEAEEQFLTRFKELTAHDNLSSAIQLELALKGREGAMDRNPVFVVSFGVCAICKHDITGKKVTDMQGDYHITCYMENR